MITTSNVQFLPPFPDGILVNEGKGADISWVAGKTYRIRFISFSAFASTMVHFNSHTMQVIMNDATYITEQSADQLRITPAQRYDVLVTASAEDQGNYPFLLALDINRDFKVDPPAQIQWNLNATGYLVTDPNGAFPVDVVSVFSPVDDSTFQPLDSGVALGPVTQTIVLDFNFCRDENNLPR